jgi:hypothetical protein
MYVTDWVRSRRFLEQQQWSGGYQAPTETANTVDLFMSPPSF